MENFYKIPSALKILLLEIVAVFFFPATAAGIINVIRPGIFPKYSDLDSSTDWLMAPVGPIFLAWVLYDIFRPRIKDQEWGIFFRVKFRFCSTHPSYVLIDAITVALATFFFWLGFTGNFDKGVFGLVLATALFIPLVRITAWYVLGMRINDIETCDAFKPALWSFCIFGLIMAAAAVGILLS